MVSTSSLRTAVFVAVLLAAAAFLGSMTAQIVRELSDLRSAPNDQIQWSTAQLDVEVLELCQAAQDALSSEAGRLPELRKRFDVFYSRTMPRGQLDALASRAGDAALTDDLRRLRVKLSDLTPVIDASDDSLVRRRAEFAEAVQALRPVTRRVTLQSLELFAREADAKRESFSRLLLRTALAASALIVALVLALMLLVRAHRLSIRRAAQIQQSNERYARTINASPEPIVVVNEAGAIIKFNPAAERAFGYSRNAVQGRRLADFFEGTPEPNGFETMMERCLAASREWRPEGWTETSARRADGQAFPVELSLGLAPGPNGALVVAYIRDISERLRTQKELMSARDEALSAARAKSQFLAIMSHEMRTPLNGVVGTLDLIGRTALTDRQRHYLDTAARSASILQAHIDDVLEITEIEAGRLRLRPEPFEVAALLHEVAAINGPAATERGNTISVRPPDAKEVVVADRHRLRQILLNLVSNAVKFTESGTVEIAAELAGGFSDHAIMAFHVRDTGIGIALEYTGRIFENFVTLDSSYRRSAPGYGLGLAICRRIAEGMGGEIGVDSAPGAGSRFWIRVPITRGEADPEVGAEGADHAPPLPSDRIGLEVLLVEDNETNRFVAREMLIGTGCTVVEARNGVEGIAAAEGSRFDLILMDLSMPGIDGLEATRRIRGSVRARSRDSLIVGLTAHVFPEDQERLRAAGMQDCLLKPLRNQTLRDLLERCRDIRAAAGPPPLSGPQGSAHWIVSDMDAFDPEVVAELSAVLTPDIFDRRLAAFRDELDENLASLAAVGPGDDLGQLARAAHKLSGSAAVFGARALSEVLRVLEAACRAGNAEDVADGLETCRSAMAEARAAIAAPPVPCDVCCQALKGSTLHHPEPARGAVSKDAGAARR